MFVCLFFPVKAEGERTVLVFLSLASFMTAGCLKYTDSLNDHMLQRESQEKPADFEDGRFFFKEGEKISRTPFECQVRSRLCFFFFL